jgi:N-acetylmuramoyl-L-alanine amidase
VAKKRVLVQAGHVAPREPGFETGTGTVREQEFTTKIRDRLALALERDGRFETLSVPGDIPESWVGDAAVFEHGDGSASATSTGYSFGFQTAAGAKLSRLISSEYEKIEGHPPHHADNYTEDLHFYYGFNHTHATGPEVLVESGFLTNPKEQTWMFNHVDDLALGQYHALRRFYDLKPRLDWALRKDGALIIQRRTLKELVQFIAGHPKKSLGARIVKVRRAL